MEPNNTNRPPPPRHEEPWRPPQRWRPPTPLISPTGPWTNPSPRLPPPPQGWLPPPEQPGARPPLRPMGPQGRIPLGDLTQRDVECRNANAKQTQGRGNREEQDMPRYYHYRCNPLHYKCFVSPTN